jgi:hypothetical protein
MAAAACSAAVRGDFWIPGVDCFCQCGIFGFGFCAFFFATTFFFFGAAVAFTRAFALFASELFLASHGAISALFFFEEAMSA